MIPIAHSENSLGRVQPLIEHLENVSKLAFEFAEPFSSQWFASWLGWWHDAGKVAADVQDYLKAPSSRPFGPDHSSAGMLVAKQEFSPLAFNIAGHHGGLADYEHLRERIQRKEGDNRILESIVEAKNLLHGKVPSHIDQRIKDQAPQERLKLEFWLRMLHSALVDADALDTEAHFSPDKSQERQTQFAISELWRKLKDDQESLMKGKRGIVNQIRAAVYQACLNSAGLPKGVFSLTVPTGGGKTRSAMAFALRHALEHGLKRVIVALPYTSIIDQNAFVYREIFGSYAVLEHHSSISVKANLNDEALDEEWRGLAAENWDAPVIVTTTVQLLESLFSNRNSRVRKLHNIAQSVILLDEVQTLPPNLLRPTLEVLQHLVNSYGVTIVLCTATQPALVSREEFQGFNNVIEIIRDPEHIYAQLKRVVYKIETGERWSWTKVAEALQGHAQALVVLNTISDAMALLDVISGEHVYHLSTQLCAAHRREVLDKVKHLLESGQPITLISTQVIEAGVDIDFPVVLRAIGPLDRIIQAAGRCNREGKLNEGFVIVFNPSDGKQPPGAYKTGTDITQKLLAENSRLDLNDPQLPLKYFKQLYDIRDLDDRGIQKYRERLQFEKTSDAYRLIDDDSVAVIVPYSLNGEEERDRIIKAIRAKHWVGRDEMRALQPYMVNIRERFHRDAVQHGACEEVVAGLWIWHGEYDPIKGLQWHEPQAKDLVI